MFFGIQITSNYSKNVRIIKFNILILQIDAISLKTSQISKCRVNVTPLRSNHSQRLDHHSKMNRIYIHAFKKSTFTPNELADVVTLRRGAPRWSCLSKMLQGIPKLLQSSKTLPKAPKRLPNASQTPPIKSSPLHVPPKIGYHHENKQRDHHRKVVHNTNSLHTIKIVISFFMF